MEVRYKSTERDPKLPCIQLDQKEKLARGAAGVEKWQAYQCGMRSGKQRGHCVPRVATHLLV